MTGNGSGVGPPLTARVVEVPLIADAVAPPRLVYGGLEPGANTDADCCYAALYFPVAVSGALGRVTFEGLDAVRAARGEMLPYAFTAPRAAGDWVFAVDGSPWTPVSTMPSRFMTSSLRSSRKGSGIGWEFRRSSRPDDDLVRDSRLCSQRLYQLNLLPGGHNREAASIWLRTRHGQLTSRLIRPRPGGELASRDGIAQLGDFAEPWESYLEGVAQRRRAMSR